jgi:hypothetical protein
MNSLLRSAAAGVPLVILLAAGLQHFAHLANLRRDLDAHDLFPASLILPVAVALGASEVAIGAGGLFAYASGSTTLAARLLLAAASLYGAFAIYASVVLRVRPGVSCGCTGAGSRMSALIAIRATVLGALCWVAAVPRLSPSWIQPMN